MESLLLRTILVYLLVVGAMRLMGKRQLGELQLSELVSTILLSNLASIAIESIDLPIFSSILPVLIITALELSLSAICFKNVRAARVLSGRPVAVIVDGVIQQQALAQLRLGIKDLFESLRGQDIYDPAEVAYAVVETNGSLNVCAKTNLTGQATLPPLPVLLDGMYVEENLRLCGQTSAWLEARLQDKGLAAAQVLAALADGSGELTLITKEKAPAQGGRRKGGKA